MPKGKTKKFIDKKNSVTFHLVHRSQKDPLAADETAPQHVLVKVDNDEDRQKRKVEQEKFGIYFDDDYNYLQHLRDVKTVEWERVDVAHNSKEKKEETTSKISLPSSVFASEVEEKVGLLNRDPPRAGPRLDWDPDVVAAMDEDFNYEDPDNMLEDNFMELAHGPAGESDEDEEYEFDEADEDGYEESETSDVDSTGHMDVSGDEGDDEVGSLNGPQFTFTGEETKSRFTEYSMSSSVMKRNDQLTLLDDKFERMYAAYDDTEIGALDCEEIEGFIAPDNEMLLQFANEFEKGKKEAEDNVAEIMKDKLKIINQTYSDSDEEDLHRLVVTAREREKWDCESVLSTYSNTYNHPKLISEPKGPSKIKIDSRTGIPKNVLNGREGKLTVGNLARLDLQNDAESNKVGQSVAGSMKSTISILSNRPPGETPEGRRDRKKALKDYRRERRIEKKANTEAFKDEKKRQEKIMLNNKQNVQNNRLV